MWIFLLAGIPILLFTLIAGYLFIGKATPSDNVEYGVTFSATYAKDLGIDPNAALRASLDDLGFRRFRIPAYWSELEPRRDWWNFSALDRQINLIESRGGTIVLAIGEKAPRWPECWAPDWWKDVPREEQKERTLLYIETVMARYKNREAIVAWQIENEPHFDYGECPKPDLNFFRQEVEHARSIDSSRPIVTTDSGELSLWATFGKTVDALGVSTYRVVQNPTIGIWRYWFVPPYFYAKKAALTSALRPDEIYVSEFQMEPWTLEPIWEETDEAQFKTFDIEQMRSNLRYAERMRMSPVDFWGVEWWYWMKEERGHPEFWDEMREFLRD